MPSLRSATAPYFCDQLAADVGVEFLIERFDLGPEALEFGGELLGRHVVVGTPEGAGVREAEFARSLVGELDEAGIAVLHGDADIVPADPHVGDLLRIAIGGEFLFEIVDGQAGFSGAAGAIFAFAVTAIEAGSGLGELGAEFGIGGRGHAERELQEEEFAAELGREVE